MHCENSTGEVFSDNLFSCTTYLFVFGLFAFAMTTFNAMKGLKNICSNSSFFFHANTGYRGGFATCNIIHVGP